MKNIFVVCPVPMLDDVGANDLPELVDVSVNGEPSPTSSPLSGTSETTRGNPGEAVSYTHLTLPTICSV